MGHMRVSKYCNGKVLPNKALLLTVLFFTYSVASLFHNADASFEGGRYAFDRGDYPSAIREFTESIRNKEPGYKNSQAYMGRIYERGLGVRKDNNKAITWYRAASSNGSKAAEKALVRMRVSRGIHTSYTDSTAPSLKMVVLLVLLVLLALVGVSYAFIGSNEGATKRKEERRKKDERERSERKRRRRARKDKWYLFIRNVQKIAGDPSKLYSRIVSEISGIVGAVFHEKEPEDKGHVVGQRLVKLLILFSAAASWMFLIVISILRYLMVFLISIIPGFFIFISSLFKREYVHPMEGLYGNDRNDWFEDEDEDEDEGGGDEEVVDQEVERYLSVLDLSMPTSLAEINTACRKKRSQYHPDRMANLGPELQKIAHLKMQEINEACAFLKEYFRDT